MGRPSKVLPLAFKGSPVLRLVLIGFNSQKILFFSHRPTPLIGLVATIACSEVACNLEAEGLYFDQAKASPSGSVLIYSSLPKSSAKTNEAMGIKHFDCMD